MSILTGQQIGGARINNSGGALAIGDVVVIDTTGNLRVKTTTTSGDLNVCGVVVEGGANGDYVRVSDTDVAKVNVDGATTRGQWLKASGTAKKATPVATRGPGCFAQALESIGAAGTIKAQLLFPAIKLVADTDVDWGTGAGQVSATDIPIADAGGKYVTDNVEAALQSVMTTVEYITALANIVCNEDEVVCHNNNIVYI